MSATQPPGADNVRTTWEPFVMIYVVATVQLKPNQRDAFLDEFRRLIPSVKAETGCIEYCPTVDLETNLPAQPPVRENTVVIVEKWQSLEALEDHLVAPHMTAYREKVKPLVESVSLQVLDSAETA